jgi:hypothetical protein
MADWVTISSLATAGGTLVLAAATFTAVRSSNRSARVAERALLAGLRPVLVPSRLGDPEEKVLFQDLRWFRLAGGRAVAEYADGMVFLIIGVRNVGTGLAVLRGWRVERGLILSTADHNDQPDPETFRLQARDIYIPAGDTGFWQGAIRDRDDPDHDSIVEALKNRESLTVSILYGDGEGGQRVITRFAVIPAGETDWLTSASRHWNLDRDDPR